MFLYLNGFSVTVRDTNGSHLVVMTVNKAVHIVKVQNVSAYCAR